jgi:hypothetical protein
MSDSPKAPEKPGWTTFTSGGPLGSLGFLLVFVGVALSLTIATWPGLVIALAGIACGITDAVSPGRDVYGRKRT